MNSRRHKINLSIRQEKEADQKSVFEVVRQAFLSEEYSDQKENFLVARLRNSEAFIPELSMVAEVEGEIVGHILLTRIRIGQADRSHEPLALAPVSVLPEYQGKGVGGQLILAAHHKAKALGHGSVVLLGHKDYYPRFGYQLASRFGIELPFDVPDENCMAIELVEGGLDGVRGLVYYPKEFYE